MVHGWNPQAYAELVGVDYTPVTKLSPQVLAARLDTILASTESLVRLIPDERMEWTPPERNRPLADLAYHIFRLSLGFAEGVDRDSFPDTVHTETAPADLRTGEAVARYGALVRARLSGWFAGAGQDEYARIVHTYWGPVVAHDLLERTTWHAGQHLRQLYILAERIALTPEAPEPVQAYAGLPMPAAIW
ncbi:MAG TPA: DinB family protein [Terriglobales bacterium]|nr:DinB family protein [Terriglobales bacterium]